MIVDELLRNLGLDSLWVVVCTNKNNPDRIHVVGPFSAERAQRFASDGENGNAQWAYNPQPLRRA